MMRKESRNVGKVPRRCRVSMARTTIVVHRATASFCQVYGIPLFEFSPSREGRSCCLNLAKEVKEFVSMFVSVDPEIQMGFQSIKKLLPPSCPCMEKPLLTKLVSSLSKKPISLPKGYLAFVGRTVRGLFRKGWDSKLYTDACYVASPNLSGTTDYPRAEGGCLSGYNDQVSFLEHVLGDTPYEVDVVSGQIMVVQSAGKPRPLTKFSSREFLLQPLHKSIYNRLSKTSWLLRGDPTADKLKAAGFLRGGGVLVSGDYKSATDNLSIEVAECILEAILDTSIDVPQSVKDHALKSLRPRLWNLELDVDFEVTRGQMMGSFLSFPLLCLQNFLSFEWARKKAGLEKMPLLINGDDILFQSKSKSFPAEWMGVVGELGLEVEQSKTSVEHGYGSINSTLLKWKEDRLYVHPTLRLGMLKSPDYATSLGKTYHSFVRGFTGEVLWRASRVYFSWHCALMRQLRIEPHEVEFRGGLAFRMARIFGLFSMGPSSPVPSPPTLHNIVMNSDDIVEVPRGSLSNELEVMQGRETTSWKFNVGYETRVRAALQYALAMSARRPILPPNFGQILSDHDRQRLGSNYFLEAEGFSWRKLRKDYFKPVSGRDTVRVFSSVLKSQIAEEHEQLPPYSEAVEGCTWGLADGDNGRQQSIDDHNQLMIAIAVSNGKPSEKFGA
nr:RNA-dependent RNA polymerase [Monilinia fructicola botourmiavirus 8]